MLSKKLFISKNILLILFLNSALLICSVTYAAKPLPKSYLVLKINSKTYSSDEIISVRKGEKIIIEAKIMGGRRAWCMYPDKFAHIGHHTKIVQNGENGLSFIIGTGNFRGEWLLEKEVATFNSGEGINIKTLPEDFSINPILRRKAELEFPNINIDETYLKVSSKAYWHYIGHSPGGKREKKEVQQANTTLHFKISTDSDAWFSSANIVAKGTENDDIKWTLGNIQNFYNTVEQQIIKGEYALAKRNMQALKETIKSLRKDIRTQKKKDPTFSCNITFLGLPTDKIMEHIKRLEILDGKFKKLYFITEGNAQKINKMLLNMQLSFTSNVLKSVFKNYIKWGTSIPTGYADFLTLYDPHFHLRPFDLPRKFMGWWEAANKDSSILADQIKTISILKELRKFYLKRMEESVKERKVVRDILVRLKPAGEINKSIKAFFVNLGWAKWRRK